MFDEGGFGVGGIVVARYHHNEGRERGWWGVYRHGVSHSNTGKLGERGVFTTYTRTKRILVKVGHCCK